MASMRLTRTAGANFDVQARSPAAFGEPLRQSKQASETTTSSTRDLLEDETSSDSCHSGLSSSSIAGCDAAMPLWILAVAASYPCGTSRRPSAEAPWRLAQVVAGGPLELVAAPLRDSAPEPLRVHLPLTQEPFGRALPRARCFVQPVSALAPVQTMTSTSHCDFREPLGRALPRARCFVPPVSALPPAKATKAASHCIYAESPEATRDHNGGDGMGDDDAPHLRPLDRVLMHAVVDGDAEAVSRSLREGGNPNLVTSGNKPLLHLAIMRAKDASVIGLLLGAGASHATLDHLGNSALHLWARSTGAKDALQSIGEALLEADAELDAQRGDGLTAMHLLAAGNNNHRGWLNFHKAVLLVRHGASTDVRAFCGRAPLDVLKPNHRNTSAPFRKLLERHCGHCDDLPTCPIPGCAWCSVGRTLHM